VPDYMLTRGEAPALGFVEETRWQDLPRDGGSSAGSLAAARCGHDHGFAGPAVRGSSGGSHPPLRRRARYRKLRPRRIDARRAYRQTSAIGGSLVMRLAGRR